MKILVHFSYNKNFEQDKNFCKLGNIEKIENISKLWHMRKLTLERRVTVFKSLAISKVIHLLLITKPNNLSFISQGTRAKIKDSTLCNGYEKGGIKNVDLRNKVITMQCSLVRRLSENDFHDRKVILLFLISQHLR